MKEIGGALGALIVLVAATLYALIAVGIAWLMGSAARLGGPDDPRRKP